MPPASVPIDVNFSHPLAPLSLYLPGRGTIDFCGYGPRLVYDSGATVNVEGLGPSFRSTASNGRVYADIVPTRWRLASTVSAFWWGRVRGNPGNDSQLICTNYNNTLTSPYVGWGFGNNLTHSTGNKLSLYWNAGGSFNFLGTSQDYTGVVSTAAGTFNTAGNMVLYADGVSVGSTAWSGGAPTWGTTPAFNLCGDSNVTSRYANTDTYAALIYDRELSAAEIARLHMAPLQFLIPGG